MFLNVDYLAPNFNLRHVDPEIDLALIAVRSTRLAMVCNIWYICVYICMRRHRLNVKITRKSVRGRSGHVVHPTDVWTCLIGLNRDSSHHYVQSAAMTHPFLVCCLLPLLGWKSNDSQGGGSRVEGLLKLPDKPATTCTETESRQ